VGIAVDERYIPIERMIKTGGGLARRILAMTEEHLDVDHACQRAIPGRLVLNRVTGNDRQPAHPCLAADDARASTPSKTSH
jgi:hypothetical protein